MPNDYNLREVDFTLCNTCKYKDEDENNKPCDFCLSEPGRYGTSTPIEWEAKDE